MLLMKPSPVSIEPKKTDLGMLVEPQFFPKLKLFVLVQKTNQLLLLKIA